MFDPVAAPNKHLREQWAADAVEARVGQAAGLLNAATASLCDAIAESIESGRWEAEEACSPEQWVVWHTGVSPMRARRLVRLARGAAEFPALWVDFRAGQLSEDQLDVIVRLADPAHDDQLVGLAGQLHVNQLTRYVRQACPRPPDPGPFDDDDAAGTEPDPPQVRDELRFGWGDDGRFRGRFDLGAEGGSLLEKALRSARGRLFAERTGTDPDDGDARVDTISWVDALERLAHAGLAGLDPATARGQRPSDRYQVLVHLDAEHPERSRIHLGPLLPKAQREQLCCDADIRALLYRRGRPIGLGRRYRTVDPLLRALIEDRDGGCRVPGCMRAAFLHIHHVEFWENGGRTDPTNLFAVCTEHHRDIHAGRLRVAGDASQPNGLAFTTGDGRPLPRPEPRTPGLPLPETPDRYQGLARDTRIDWSWL